MAPSPQLLPRRAAVYSAARPFAHILGRAGVVILLALSWGVDAAEVNPPAARDGAAETGMASASSEVRYVAKWAIETQDNGDMPYIVVDKVNAKVFVFDAHGNLQGSTLALLGMAKGDRMPPGIGNQTVLAIAPADRITPAGRFVASPGRTLHGGDILWIDYATALALHPVVAGTKLEHRAQRLASATSDDHRISYGCINVPAAFYGSVVKPAFANRNSIVYILPEQSSARDMFVTRVGDAAGMKPDK